MQVQLAARARPPACRGAQQGPLCRCWFGESVMRTRQQGVALIEFALILPFLLMLTFTITELGRAMFEYNTVAKATRDAVRYISVQTPNTHQAEAQNLIVYGNIEGTGQPLARGLTLTNVPPPTWGTAGAAPVINTVTVQVTNYQFQSIAATVFGLPFGTITYGDITATMRSPL